MSTNETSSKQQRGSIQAITDIEVRGFKSLVETSHIEIRPLTILAGANSSGKSSAMQPLLLLKQTLEASYDPGPLLLYGPNVRFTSEEQFLALTEEEQQVNSFTISVKNNDDATLTTTFELQGRQNMVISAMKYRNNGQELILQPEMEHERILRELSPLFSRPGFQMLESAGQKMKINRARCFLMAELRLDPDVNDFLHYSFEPSQGFEEGIRRIIHVPGLRGNPTRTYKTTVFGTMFPGTFENYVASIIYQWQVSKEQRLSELEKVLARLGLTWKLDAKQVDKTQVELRVGRLPRHRKAKGMVNIADVGFGVSQVLPVLVALLVASPGQIVYIEQPEIHLHPRAQAALAEVLIEAANRGVRVVAETHSSLLLTAIQTRVARGEIGPNKVMLHWFQQDEKGVTQISSTELDEAGAFGEWPIDFADVELEVASDYLDAAEAILIGE